VMLNSARASSAGFFRAGEAHCERRRECMYEYMTDRANNATKPAQEETS